MDLMTETTDVLRVGDTVVWRGAWGAGAPTTATIARIEITDQPGSKYGTEATEVPWSVVRENRVCVDLTNGSWSYGSQLSKPAPPVAEPRHIGGAFDGFTVTTDADPSL